MLRVDYEFPTDTVRVFHFSDFSFSHLILVEGDKIFELHHGFPNKVSIFSKNLNSLFDPIVEIMAGIIFFDITKLFGTNKKIPFIVVWLVFGEVSVSYTHLTMKTILLE